VVGTCVGLSMRTLTRKPWVQRTAGWKSSAAGFGASEELSPSQPLAAQKGRFAQECGSGRSHRTDQPALRRCVVTIRSKPLVELGGARHYEAHGTNTSGGGFVLVFFYSHHHLVRSCRASIRGLVELLCGPRRAHTWWRTRPVRKKAHSKRRLKTAHGRLASSGIEESPWRFRPGTSSRRS